MVASAPPGPVGHAADDPRAEVEALLRWHACEGVGIRALREAVSLAGSARALLQRGDAGQLLGVPGAAPAPREEVVRVAEECRAAGVRAVGWGEATYPPKLLHLADPPPVIFVRGELPDPSRPAVAVVGARKASGYGRRIARSLACALARHGVPVVSGMALGIDGEAHAGALEGRGATVAVLGGGVERARPASHGALYRRILSDGGAVVGEWAPGTPARAFHFPRRNRILAALSDLVVVVEAGERSGALSTAAHARRLGREVAAVPGPVDRPGHVGANRLIRDGCAPILEVRDILDRVGVLAGPLATPAAEPGVHLDGDAAPVWRCLAEGPSDLETLARRAGLEPARVLRALTRLEIEGWVGREGGLHARRSSP